MNEDDYAEFSVLVDATIVVDRIDNRHGGNLAAIADALIAVFVDVYID